MEQYMKNIMQKLAALLFLLLISGCGQESCAAEKEYEFLTPQTVVVKTSGRAPFNHSTVGLNIISEGFWIKENGLLRDANGNIQKKADITAYNFLTFGKPFQPGEKRNLHTVTLHYNPAIPSKIFKLNQLGYGENQKKKFAYMGAWLGSAGALPLKHLAGTKFEIRRSSDGKCVYKNSLKLRRDPDP